MSKHIFSLIFRIVLLCIFIFGGLGTVYAASPGPIGFDGLHTWTVRPLNKTPDDAANLQKAINQAAPGDTILLAAGVFNFGDFDSVGIPKDLTIEGAWDDALGVPLTTILGGWSPITIGGMRTGETPGMMKVKGHNVVHITKELAGQFYFPFLYPPYFDQDTQTQLEYYDLTNFWTAVTVNIRQITFMRPYHVAIYFGAMNGGLVERCRFISAWPLDMDWWGGDPLAMGIHWYNQQMTQGWASGAFGLPYATNSFDANRGDVTVRNNVFEGDLKEFLAGEVDEYGQTLFAPYDGHSAPPDNDYATYVIQDVYSYTSMFLFHPDQPPAQFWVRKGYTLFWGFVNGQESYVARRGNSYGLEITGTQMNLNVEDNYFRNQVVAINSAGPNAQFGAPENLTAIGNTIQSDIHTHISPCVVIGIVAGDWYGGSPGTSAVVKNNQIDITCTGADGAGSIWNASAIDLEVMGQVVVTGNRVKVNSEGGIAIWYPSQSALVQNNEISGAGDYAFASFWSNHTQYINNKVSNFLPNGKGVYDAWGDGWPGLSVPAARGILYGSDWNTVHGVGKPDPLDVVIVCGEYNQVTNMTVMDCPVPAASSTSSLSAASRTLPVRPEGWKKQLAP